MRTIAAFLGMLAACAGTGATGFPPLASKRSVPAKCTACHLAPKENSLLGERWDRFLKRHRRRAHLTDEEKSLLYDFLVGGEMPKDIAEGGAR
jgi:hypothetical protein